MSIRKTVVLLGGIGLVAAAGSFRWTPVTAQSEPAGRKLAFLVGVKNYDHEGLKDLDFPENKIRLDAEGRVAAIERIENDVSHQLIEEYMLLANQAVAAKLMGLPNPAVYRVHEAPKASRLEQFRDDVLSHRIPCGDRTLKSEVHQKGK